MSTEGIGGSEDLLTMVNKQTRRSKATMQAIRDEIVAVLEVDNPMTVRQVFYQLVVRGVIDKSEQAYHGVVIRLLTEMRMSGEISFSWIVDESRRTRDTQTHDNITDALNDTARFYRRSALRQSDVYIEIWSEKEALSGCLRSKFFSLPGSL